MSISEFFIDNGIDPTDPNHMDEYLGRFEHQYDHRPHQVEFCGVAIDMERTQGNLDDDSDRVEFSDVAIIVDKKDTWPVEEGSLDRMATTQGWTKDWDGKQSCPNGQLSSRNVAS